MQKIIINLIVFLYIYSVPFKFFPIGISTRPIFGLFGFIFYFLFFIKKDYNFYVNKYFVCFIFLLTTLSFFSGLSMLINQTSDFAYIKYNFTIIVTLFAGYFVIIIIKKLNYSLNFQSISQLIINAIFLQSIIALLMYLSPEISNFLYSVQNISTYNEERYENLSGFRIIGFAAKFFGAGIISGYALLLIAMIIRFTNLPSKELFLLSFQFIIILIIGMMMARTTIIGGILAILLLMLPYNLQFTISLVKKRIIFFSLFLVFPCIVVILLFLFSSELYKSLTPAFNFAFEMFINYFEKGQMETASTNQLATLFVFPTDIKTYFIGDGYFDNPNGWGYYMNTDVGYLRMIYYFGTIGMLMYFITQYYALSVAFKRLNVPQLFILIMFLYLLVLNVKGFADILMFTILFWFSSLIRGNNDSSISKNNRKRQNGKFFN